jgi:hypothetical protein
LEELCGLVLFESTNVALKTERDLKAAGVACAVIPTPVEFASGCGIALLVTEPMVEDTRNVLEGCVGHRFIYPYDREQRSR